MDNLNKIIVLLAFITFGCIVYFTTKSRNTVKSNIKMNQKVITCKIKKTESAGYRGGSLNIYVKYNWQEVEGEQVFMTPKTKCAVIGRELLLVIDSTNVENAKLLLKPEDFSEFNLTFPDSFNWAKECFKL